jgi:acetaldehyde dehydrogenase (acetylating)
VNAPAVSAPAVPRVTRSSSRAQSRKKSRRLLWLAVSGLVVAVAVAVAAVAVLLRPAAGTRHILITPARIGSYALAPNLAKEMKAEQLKSGIVARSSGEATHVVDAVYEDAARTGPEIVLFIGGNLSGTSASSFISSFIGKLQGAVTASPGSLAGDAACVPSVDGRPAECAWADNDTFGVLASPTLSATALANELRQMRPAVERRAGS